MFAHSLYILSAASIKYYWWDFRASQSNRSQCVIVEKFHAILFAVDLPSDVFPFTYIRNAFLISPPRHCRLTLIGPQDVFTTSNMYICSQQSQCVNAILPFDILGIPFKHQITHSHWYQSIECAAMRYIFTTFLLWREGCRHTLFVVSTYFAIYSHCHQFVCTPLSQRSHFRWMNVWRAANCLARARRMDVIRERETIVSIHISYSFICMRELMNCEFSVVLVFWLPLYVWFNEAKKLCASHSNFQRELSTHWDTFFTFPLSLSFSLSLCLPFHLFRSVVLHRRAICPLKHSSYRKR